MATYDSADLLATKMPLLEVFVAEFLSAVEHVVKRHLIHIHRRPHVELFNHPLVARITNASQMPECSERI